MKSLQDDSLPIDVTGDDPTHKQQRKTFNCPIIIFYFPIFVCHILLNLSQFEFQCWNKRNTSLFRATTTVTRKISTVMIHLILGTIFLFLLIVVSQLLLKLTRKSVCYRLQIKPYVTIFIPILTIKKLKKFYLCFCLQNEKLDLKYLY